MSKESASVDRLLPSYSGAEKAIARANLATVRVLYRKLAKTSARVDKAYFLGLVCPRLQPLPELRVVLERGVILGKVAQVLQVLWNRGHDLYLRSIEKFTTLAEKRNCRIEELLITRMRIAAIHTPPLCVETLRVHAPPAHTYT